MGINKEGLNKIYSIEQTSGWCGPNALEIAAKLDNIEVNPLELADAMAFNPDDGITDFKQMIDGARYLGYQTRETRDLSLEKLGIIARSGARVIVCWMVTQNPFEYTDSGHFSVLKYAKGHEVSLIDPQLGVWQITTTKENFERFWFDVDNNGVQKHYALILWKNHVKGK